MWLHSHPLKRRIVLRNVLRVQTLLWNRDPFSCTVENRALEHIALSFEVRIYAQPVVLVNREQLPVKHRVMGLTECQHVREISPVFRVVAPRQDMRHV